jgi:hypothetical protein
MRSTRPIPRGGFSVEGEVLVVGAIFPEQRELRVTLGLAMDVPYTPEVSHLVNRLNNKELIFGRMFPLLRTVATLSGQAGRLAPSLRGERLRVTPAPPRAGGG